MTDPVHPAPPSLNATPSDYQPPAPQPYMAQPAPGQPPTVPPYPGQPTGGYPPHAYPGQPAGPQPYPGQQGYAAYPAQPPYPQPHGYPVQPYPGPAPVYGGYPAPAPHPQIVVNNVVSSGAAAGGFGYAVGLRKRQSFGVHVILFLFTAGIGNVLYGYYVWNWNQKRGL